MQTNKRIKITVNNFNNKSTSFQEYATSFNTNNLRDEKHSRFDSKFAGNLRRFFL